MSKRKLQSVGFYSLAIVLGLFTAYSDLHTDDTQFIAGFLVVFGFGLGFGQPRKAWRWALILAIWTPLFEALQPLLSGKTLTLERVLEPCLAFIFALVGAYLGAVVGKSWSRQNI